MKNSVHISVVVPVYGCAKSLSELCQRLNTTLSAIDEKFEILLVNDERITQTDAWDEIVRLAALDHRIKGINLSRNFGQHKAITAGIDYAYGDWVVVMDCDLQDQPEEISKLYAKAQEGYDVVFGRRHERQDSTSKKLGSILFYKIYDYLTESDTDNTVANFSIISQEVAQNYRKLREQNRSFPFFVRWMGFKSAKIDIEHAARKEGETSYSFIKLLNLASDNIISQSNKLLRMSIHLGFTMSGLAFLYILFLVYKYFFLSVAAAGWTTVVASIYLIGGMIFANLGILGIYIGKTFNETKGRPIYIVSETTWEEKEEEK